ncbi:MAG: AAA family ATPase, partial [Promethearchaeota archaeon]
SFKDTLLKKGLQFGGRVLLIGPPGTDFDAFVYHLASEVPMKLARLQMSAVIGESNQISEALRTAVEFTKRNPPVVLYLEQIELLGRESTNHASILFNSFKELSWDENEVLVVCSTSNPDKVERDLLTSFDRVYIFPAPLLNERVQVFETLLEGRKDLDPALLGELTDGWGFADIQHLSVNLLTDVPEGTEQLPRVKLEQVLDSIGVRGLARYETYDTISRAARGEHAPAADSIVGEYPDDFLDQLYLMAVGDDFQGTQRIIETLNENLPLTPQDRDFLSKYPFLLPGNPEDRLTRLMRAKRTSDRLSRMMGR